MSEHHSTDIGQVEPEGISSVALFGIVGFTIVLLVIVVVAAVQISLLEFNQARLDATAYSGYPLQEETRAEGESLLNRSGPVAGETGVYRMPIERAMERIVAMNSQ